MTPGLLVNVEDLVINGASSQHPGILGNLAVSVALDQPAGRSFHSDLVGQCHASWHISTNREESKVSTFHCVFRSCTWQNIVALQLFMSRHKQLSGLSDLIIFFPIRPHLMLDTGVRFFK